MRLKTFLAKDIKAALSAMRAELGDDAIIVARETMKDGSVMLRAGIERASAAASRKQETPSTPDTPRNAGEQASFDANYHQALIARLRATKPQAGRPAISFDRAGLLELLLMHRTPDRLSQTLATTAATSGPADLMQALAAVFEKRMGTLPVTVKQQNALLLIGPPGAGKTAIAAKLAAQYRLTGRPVQLIATDLQGAGQTARLQALASCLNVDVAYAADADELSRAIREAQTHGIALIADSAGFDPRGAVPPEMIAVMGATGFHVLGVVSAAADAEEVADIAAALKRLGTKELIVTGLDLARRKGALVALACSGLPIAQTTSSPYLADGFQMFTPAMLAQSLVAGAASAAARKVA